MSGEPLDAERETGNAAVADAPTANLRTGTESTEKLDATFELLSHPLRRDVLYRLDETDGGSLDLAALADAVAANGPSGDGSAPDPTTATLFDGDCDGEWSDELDGAPTEGEWDDVQSVAHQLHNVHLPKLEAHGVVSYDPERHVVRYRERTWLTEWLEHVRQAE